MNCCKIFRYFCDKECILCKHVHALLRMYLNKFFTIMFNTNKASDSDFFLLRIT